MIREGSFGRCHYIHQLKKFESYVESSINSFLIWYDSFPSRLSLFYIENYYCLFTLFIGKYFNVGLGSMARSPTVFSITKKLSAFKHGNGGFVSLENFQREIVPKIGKRGRRRISALL
jgi:hypothetical protein